MQCKIGVYPAQLQTETLFAMLLCEDVLKSTGHDLIITSISDGLHKKDSLHYDGFAFDLRINHLRGISSCELRDRLQRALPFVYQVILEPSHIHVEYDP